VGCDALQQNRSLTKPDEANRGFDLRFMAGAEGTPDLTETLPQPTAEDSRAGRGHSESLQSEQLALTFVGDLEHPDDDPRIGGPKVELLRGAKKEVQIARAELAQVLGADFRKGRGLVPVRAPQAIPVQRPRLPIENLQLALPPVCVLKAIGEAVGELRDDLERLPPRLLGEEFAPAMSSSNRE
jgi:hypothetical protein